MSTALLAIEAGRALRGRDRLACSATRTRSRAAPGCSAWTRSACSPTRSRTCSRTRGSSGELPAGLADPLLRAGDALRGAGQRRRDGIPRGRRPDRASSPSETTVGETPEPSARQRRRAAPLRVVQERATGPPRTRRRRGAPRVTPRLSRARPTVRVPAEKLDAARPRRRDRAPPPAARATVDRATSAAARGSSPTSSTSATACSASCRTRRSRCARCRSASITAPFPRAVRDIASAEGKEVELVVTGAETELDRVILEASPSRSCTAPQRGRARHRDSRRARGAASRRAGASSWPEQRGGIVAIDRLRRRPRRLAGAARAGRPRRARSSTSSRGRVLDARAR